MNLKSTILTFSFFAFSTMTTAFAVEAPAWLKRDLARGATWLPALVKSRGLTGAYEERIRRFPPEVQAVLISKNIPEWMIALVPTEANIQREIHKQLLGMMSLSGSPARGELARRAEELLVFGGAAQLPTPGDEATGRSLGPQGCTAAISKYVLSQLKSEFPERLSGIPARLGLTQSSGEMKELFGRLARKGVDWFQLKTVSFDRLNARDITPGTIMIAQKPGGTHVIAWTRVLSFWGWSPSAKMAIGNTGLPQFGSRLILAQEYISNDPQENEGGYAERNEHGPINSRRIIRDRAGRPVLSDPRTNVYAAQGSEFLLIQLN